MRHLLFSALFHDLQKGGRRRNRNKKRWNLKQNDNQKVNILNYIRFLSVAPPLTTHFDVLSPSREKSVEGIFQYWKFPQWNFESNWAVKSRKCWLVDVWCAQTSCVHTAPKSLNFKLKNSIDSLSGWVRRASNSETAWGETSSATEINAEQKSFYQQFRCSQFEGNVWKYFQYMLKRMRCNIAWKDSVKC